MKYTLLLLLALAACAPCDDTPTTVIGEADSATKPSPVTSSDFASK